MSRRFFSGKTVQAAVLAAASHYGIEPDELAYEEIDKRHGLLKSRGKVVIAVDPVDPRRPAAAARAGAPAPQPAPERRPEPDDGSGGPEIGEARAPEEPAAAAAKESAAPAPPPRTARVAEPEQPADGEAEPESAPAEAEAEGAGAPRRRRGRGGRARGRATEEEPPRSREAREETARPMRAAAEPAAEALTELPDQPRALRDRFQPAEGPLAEAAGQAVAAIAAVAGLELETTVLQGEDRLEIDLAGPHHELLIAEDGELLVAIEHLLPRVMRGYGGETAAVRVDCENFQEIREERLRSFAQQVADEVRRSGRAKSLEPLSPADRRIVHLTVADEPGVESESEGSGYLKRVRISPA